MVSFIFLQIVEMPSQKSEHMHQIARSTRTPYTVSRNIHHTLRAIMHGGMNSQKYNMLSNLHNIDFNVSNLNEPLINDAENNAPTISRPWNPVISGTLHFTLETKVYSFVLREEYQCTDNVWYMYVRIGSERNPNCVVAVLDSDTAFQSATLLELKYAASCSSCSALPGKGVGARILMYVMLRYLREKDVQEYKLSDNAMQSCPSKERFALSDLYFLAHGETYYHKFGFFPSRYKEEYIQLAVFMKTVQWKDMQLMNSDADFTTTIHALEKIANPINSELAKDVLKRVWSMDCDALKKCSHILMIYIAKYLNLTNLYLNVPQIWNAHEQICSEEMRDMYDELLSESDRELFYESVREP